MRCLSCDFDLSQTSSGRCPECGRDFDSANPSTFAGEHNTRFARRLAAPPGWPMATAAALVALLVLRASFSPGHHIYNGLEALLASIVLALVYLGRAGCAVVGHRLLPGRRPRVVSIAPLRWLVAPAIIALAVLLNGTGAPRRIAFELDRRALEPLATGAAVQPSAWMPVSAWSGRVVCGAVWNDIEVAAFDPATPLGRMEGEFTAEKDGSDPRWYAHDRHLGGDADVPGIVRLRLRRLAVFPLEWHGYANYRNPAWAYAPGAPDTFFHAMDFTFHRYSGDWFVSRGEIAPVKDQSP